MHGDHSTLMKIQKTLDTYAICIRQVAALFGYGEPQVLEVFKKNPSIKTVLVSLSNRRCKANSKNSKKNTYRKEDR